MSLYTFVVEGKKRKEQQENFPVYRHLSTNSAFYLSPDIPRGGLLADTRTYKYLHKSWTMILDFLLFS